MSWILVSACAISGKFSTSQSSSNAPVLVTTCAVPATEANTIQGNWTTPSPPPVKVSFHSGDFASGEITAIQAGGATWNSFMSASKSFTMFDMGPAGTGYTSALNQDTPSGSNSTISDGAVLYKLFSGWPFSSAAIAITTTAYTIPNGSPTAVPRIMNAIIQFNYVNFFTSSSGHYPDMQSIAVHELGHLLGLDHTCGPLGRPNQSKAYTACPDPTSDPNDPLYSTIMYPTVFFDQDGTGETKQALSADDESRANCAYTAGYPLGALGPSG